MAKRAKNRIRSDHDPITGLYKNRRFASALHKTIAQSKRGREGFSLLIIGIDNLRQINDHYGHSAGDRIIKELSHLLEKSIRKVDSPFRYGDDEIAIILPTARRKTAERIIDRLTRTVEAHSFPGDIGLPPGLKIGLAVFPEDGTKAAVLIRRARIRSSKDKPSRPLILKTKLALPILKDTIVPRPRLLSRLDENLDKGLILIIADAGYGKTTLLAQLIKARNQPFVFYDLDKTDGDFVVFLSYLLHGLEQLQPNLGRRTGILLEHGADVLNNPILLIDTLIDELTKKLNGPIWVILDDYHTLPADSPALQGIDRFIERRPAMVKMVIVSRTNPELKSLISCRDRHDVFVLSREDLKFTKEEIMTLLQEIYRMALSDEEFRRISDHTEGWATGIQMIVQSAGRDQKTIRETLNGYVEANQPLFEYFAQEILKSENPRIQNFLKASGLLEIITPDACDEILAMKGADRLLRALERRNLFLYTIGSAEYKYHNLFRNFLRQQLTDPGVKQNIHLRAARYYQDRHYFEPAINHYLQAMSFEPAGRLINKVANDMLEQARLSTVDDWIGLLPESVLKRYPLILTALAVIYRSQGNQAKAEEACLKAERHLEEKGNRTDLAGTMVRHSEILHERLAHAQALKVLRKALRICPASAVTTRAGIFNMLGLLAKMVGDSRTAEMNLNIGYRLAYQSRDKRTILMLGNNLAFHLMNQGEIKHSYELFRSLLDEIKGRYTLQIGIVFTGAARVALSLGQISDAEKFLEKGWDMCRLQEDPYSRCALHEGFGLLYTFKKNWTLAGQYLNRALDEAIRIRWKHHEFFILLFLVQLNRYQKEFREAERYLGLMRQGIDNIHGPRGIIFFIEATLTKIAAGKNDEAVKMIRTNLQRVKKFGRKLDRFRLNLAQAAVHLAQGNEPKAKNYLGQALHQAEHDGYHGLLMSELDSLPGLLDLAYRIDRERDYLKSLNIRLSSTESEIHIRCFGGLQIQDRAGHTLPVVWATEKAQSLFNFLINQRNNSISPSLILETLWPGSTKKRAGINFRTTATRMRQALFKAMAGKVALDRIFVRHQGRYRLLPGFMIHVDTEQFDTMIKEASRSEAVNDKIRLLRQALDLYKGEYLPELYDQWVDEQRRVFRERWLNTLARLAHYLFEDGDIGCIEVCERYLETDPLSEEITRLYMKGLSRLGRIAALKAGYQKLKRLMHKELDAAPGPETKSLYHNLLKAAGQPDQPKADY